MRCMDNFEVTVCAYEAEDLKRAIDLIMADDVANHWIKGDEGLHFFNHPHGQVENTHPFPVELGPNGVFEVVRLWLQNADYGEELDIDGSVSRGFMVTARSDKSPWLILSVKPLWAIHHK